MGTAEESDSHMPELPEVETVRRGLEPSLVGRTIASVAINRTGLRYPFPSDLQTIVASTIVSVDRRSKYLLIVLDDGRRLLCHLGMTGRFRFAGQPQEKHDHLVIHLSDGNRLIYNDARRFGFVQLLPAGEDGRFLEGLGPEPLSPDFDGAALIARLKGRKGPLKTALMDQRVVAGIGNIYACEVLFRTRLSPNRIAASLTLEEAHSVVAQIKRILEEAIAAGGSTLKDYRKADGGKGSFQDRFDVYGKEGKPCPSGHPVERLVHGGRSTFHCPVCQSA